LPSRQTSPISAPTLLKIQPKNVDQLVNFWPPHPPFVGFVANKERTAIRLDGRPSGRSLFSRFFGLESRSIFSAAPIADFTLWLIDKRALDRRDLMTDLLVFKDLIFKETPPGRLDVGLKHKMQTVILSLFILFVEIFT